MGSESKKVIRKIGAAFFSDGKVLMTRSHGIDVLYVPGGKLEEGESDIDCLAREIMEELNVEIDRETVKFLEEFQDEAYGKINADVNIRLFTGKLLGEPKATNEVAEIIFADSSIDSKYLAPIDRQILPWLKKKGYID